MSLLLLAGCSQGQDPQIAFDGPTMGTYYSVKIARPPEGMSAESLQPQVAKVLDEVVSEISTYDPKSELSRLNQNPSTDWIPISVNLHRVILEGQRISSLTDGAFDISIGPLVNLWGFGPETRPARLPTEAEIAAAKARVGWHKLELRADPPALRKERGDIYIDLSALGEGYGADRVGVWLESQGIRDYMVAVAGAIRTRGLNAKGEPWAIAIEEPLPDRRSVHRVIPVSNRALSTSGDYRNFFEEQGKRYSHEIDPMTGEPVDKRLGSVTVVADTSMLADGWATALMVLGDRRGPQVAEAQGLAAYFIVRDQNDQPRGFGSPTFVSFVEH